MSVHLVDPLRGLVALCPMQCLTLKTHTVPFSRQARVVKIYLFCEMDFKVFIVSYKLIDG